MEHTPGPWKVSLSADALDSETFGEGFQPMGGCGCCGSPWVNGDYGADVANARLIAACPAILDALIELIAAGDESVSSSDHVAAMLRFGEAHAAAKAAIAKATGDAT